MLWLWQSSLALALALLAQTWAGATPPAHVGLAGDTACESVVSMPGPLPDCSGETPPPGASCVAHNTSGLTPARSGFTIEFRAALRQQKASPYQMGLLSQCDCVCNRPGVPAEGLHPAGFLLATTNCRDPLNHSDPRCWQNDFTNISFYLANTNHTYKGVWPVGDTGADGWLEGPAMVNNGGISTRPLWNNVSIVWTPDPGTGGWSGSLAMGVQYADPLRPGRVVSGRTTHRLTNASNIGGSNYEWVFGASRFPKESGWGPCHHFFGELEGLYVYNGVGCAPPAS